MSTSANEKAGQSGRKSVKSGSSYVFPPPGGATEYIAYRSVRYMYFSRATITRDIFITSPTQCGLSRSLTNRQNTQHFTSLKREFALPSTGSCMVAESSEFHLTLKRAHIFYYSAFFPTRNRPTPKKRDILSVKRESGMTQKSVS